MNKSVKPKNLVTVRNTFTLPTGKMNVTSNTGLWPAHSLANNVLICFWIIVLSDTEWPKFTKQTLYSI